MPRCSILCRVDSAEMVEDVNARAPALHANLPIRSSYFADPGPATTGVPLPALAYESMVIEIDAFAMTEKDDKKDVELGRP